MVTALVEPTLSDVLAAAARIRPYLAPSPFRQSPAISEMVGADVYLKHEFHLPTGAFKVRGGVNLVSQLSPREREAGVIAASTGNHGQSVAYAARLFGVKAIICAPESSNPAKVEAMKELGATVNLVGADFDEARGACERLAAANGYRYIHSGNEPLLIAGVGTHTLEILSEEPRIDVIVVPRGRKAWPPGPRSSCRSGSCAGCLTTSCWFPRRRSRPRFDLCWRGTGSWWKGPARRPWRPLWRSRTGWQASASL